MLIQGPLVVYHQLGGQTAGMWRRAPPSPGRARAGVIPIDRLTDVRAPVAVIAARIPRAELEAAYSARLPRPAAHEPPARRAALSLLPGDAEMLVMYAGLPFVLMLGSVVDAPRRVQRPRGVQRERRL